MRRTGGPRRARHRTLSLIPPTASWAYCSRRALPLRPAGRVRVCVGPRCSVPHTSAASGTWWPLSLPLPAPPQVQSHRNAQHRKARTVSKPPCRAPCGQAARRRGRSRRLGLRTEEPARACKRPTLPKARLKPLGSPWIREREENSRKAESDPHGGWTACSAALVRTIRASKMSAFSFVTETVLTRRGNCFWAVVWPALCGALAWRLCVRQSPPGCLS